MGLDEDFALALALENEDKVNSPYENVNNAVKPCRKIPESTSLADPSWELVDPTPDIFALFIAFDLRFFWGKLKSVVIRWSKRMYMCAGICSYAGRCGLCTISLSEPLLKLRPRKDLVETLLHEMIHAYLFVTHNNKDRDGHGPEFHKHMYRINGEAGINITVYHSFHDEVNVYKTHWWRCNGPCRSKAPHFGTVKRSINRAPGPSDFWWKQHQMNCGGAWEKIKEPDNFKKKQVKNTATNNIHSMGDITKYIDNKGNKGMTSNRGGTLVITKPPATQTKVNPVNKEKPSASTKPPSGYNTIADYMTKPKDTPKTAISTNSNTNVNNSPVKPFKTTVSGNLLNVKGFKDLNAAEPKRVVPVFFGSGKTLGSSSNFAGKTKDEPQSAIRNSVRNHWADKFGGPSGGSAGTNSTLNKRRKLLDGYIEIKDDDYVPRKNSSMNSYDIIIIDDKKKNNSNSKSIIIDDDNEIEMNIIKKNKSYKENDISIIIDDETEPNCSNHHTIPDNDLELKPFEIKVNCPICQKSVYEKYINEHLDCCMISGSNDLQNDVILISEFDGDDTLVDDLMNKSNESHSVNCPMCNIKVKSESLSEHLETCDKLDFTQNNVNTNVEDVDNINVLKQIGYTDEEIKNYLKNTKRKEFKPVVTSPITNSNAGISNQVQNIDQDYLNESVNVNFIGTQIIDDENEDYLGDLSQNNDIELNDFPCPSCYKRISLEDMNSHLDECLCL